MPRFQFTIRAMMWTTFWVAVSCQAWWLAWHFQPADSLAWRYGIISIALICPFIAIGAILERMALGVLCGYWFTAILFIVSLLEK